MVAAEYQHKNVALFLLEHGASIDFQDGTGHSALIRMCIEGKYLMAKLLLEKGANPNLQDINKTTALSFSCSHGDYEIAKLLLDFN